MLSRECNKAVPLVHDHVLNLSIGLEDGLDHLNMTVITPQAKDEERAVLEIEKMADMETRCLCPFR